MPRTASELDDAQARPAKLEPVARSKPAPAVGEALLTCVLVLYPALATVAMIAAGLLFSGMSA